jgi:cyclopropane fatty-acyl-phospholipid synthase-like methyltransferase
MRRTAKRGEKPWDSSFSDWIAKAQAQGRDPNDVADETWGDVRHLIDKYYGPHLSPESTVLELGPGSGRITRHIIHRCKKLILVDYSDFVIKWVTDYFTTKQKRNFTGITVTDCRLRSIADASVHLIVSDGVFHHIDVEDFYRYAVAFKRVLVPGSAVAVNFVNITSIEGFAFFRNNADGSDKRDLFRWYHPETVSMLFRNLGFEQIELHNERVRAGDFVTYITCRKPS